MRTLTSDANIEHAPSCVNSQRFREPDPENYPGDTLDDAL